MTIKKRQSESIQIDPNALRIMDLADCTLEFAEAKEGELRTFRMVGYSGKVIKGHWWWGNLAIDLEGIKFNKPKFPILRDHDTNREMAFSKKPQVSNEEGLVFTEKEVTFLDTEEATTFLSNSKAGFPYQASISGRPTIIEQVEEGESVEVNGHTLKGPGTVWRKTEFRECSICVFGYDDQTTAQAFSSSGQHISIEVENIGSDHDRLTDNMEVSSMDLIKLKKDSPKEYEALMAQVAEANKAETATAVETAVSEAVAEVQLKLDERDAKIISLTEENSGLSDNLTSLEDRQLVLEKKDALREEADIESQANSVWATALAKSGLPSWLYPKVEKQVTRNKFMVDGAFDKAAFIEAVNAEIADWETKSSQEVEGFGITVKDADGHTTPEQLGSDVIVNRMLGYVGQPSQATH